jgi:hypothetical protein
LIPAKRLRASHSCNSLTESKQLLMLIISSVEHVFC